MAVVTTTAPTSITAGGAQTGGTITSSGNSPISQSGICWALHNTPTVGDSVVNSNVTSTGAFSITLNNFNANTVYYIRAFVINGVGTAYGAVDSFTTAAGVPTLSTTAISNNEALTAQSGGGITNNGGAPVTASGICWSTSANPTIAGSKTVGTVATGSFSDTLTNLSLGATYYVRSYATNSYGTGYGNQVTFTVSATGTITDIDGNVYGTITIGTQTWMTSNLKVTHYQNGDSLINGATYSGSLVASSSGIYLFPNGDTTQNALYGKYYDPAAITDSRNIAPAGWHVPTDEEWYTLELYEGMDPTDTLANFGGPAFQGTIGGNLLVNGSSGLNLQLAGYYCPGCGLYKEFGQQGVYFSATYPVFPLILWYRAFNTGTPGQIYRGNSYYYASVRCVKD